ncbi:MAG: ABC transporter substrate-binding protein [Pseudomonadota bacterium]
MFVVRSLMAMISLALISLSVPLVHADEACEDFVEETLENMFSTLNGSQTTADDDLSALVQANVDTPSIAKFTLGKYANRISLDELDQYARALNRYFLDTIHENIQGGQGLSVDILKSFDRSNRDCIVETVVHRGALDDIVVAWRVMHVGDNYQVIDLAIETGGNTIWLAIELRAQVVALFERSNGDMDVVINELGMG